MKNLMIALLIAAGVFAIWYWWTHRTTTTTTSGTGDLVGSLTSADESVNGNGVIITADDGTSSPVIGSTVASNTGVVLDNLTVNSLTNPVVPTGKALTVSTPIKILGITVGTKQVPVTSDGNPYSTNTSPYAGYTSPVPAAPVAQETYYDPVTGMPEIV